MNTYRIIVNEKGHDFILSEEGCTQGDVAAMAKYAIGIKPLINNLSVTKCKQVWYADDSSSAGQTFEIRKWQDRILAQGPQYGYFPLPLKTVLIVKPQFEDKAREAFQGTGITITTDGERHIGAVIGSTAARDE